MNTTLLHTTCPCCAHPFALTEDDLIGAGPTAEVECPVCAEDFSVDEDGRALEADEEAPFEVNDEGELVVDEVLLVTCPHCACVQEIDEPGAIHCRRCQRALWAHENGEADEGMSCCPQCDRRTNGPRALGEPCRGCGYLDEDEV